jgi:hypothetical protein
VARSQGWRSGATEPLVGDNGGGVPEGRRTHAPLRGLLISLAVQGLRSPAARLPLATCRRPSGAKNRLFVTQYTLSITPTLLGRMGFGRPLTSYTMSCGSMPRFLYTVASTHGYGMGSVFASPATASVPPIT